MATVHELSEGAVIPGWSARDAPGKCFITAGSGVQVVERFASCFCTIGVFWCAIKFDCLYAECAGGVAAAAAVVVAAGGAGCIWSEREAIWDCKAANCCWNEFGGGGGGLAWRSLLAVHHDVVPL